MSSSDDSTCVIIINLEVEIKMCLSLSFWILFPVKIIQKHACTSCMHFELIIDQVSVLYNPLHACIISCLQQALSLCMHENACKSANLHACIMHASCMQCLHDPLMQHACCACMIHACSAGMHSLEGTPICS